MLGVFEVRNGRSDLGVEQMQHGARAENQMVDGEDGIVVHVVETGDDRRRN